MNENSQMKDKRVIFILLPRISQKGFFVSLLAIIIFKPFFLHVWQRSSYRSIHTPFFGLGRTKKKIYSTEHIFFSKTMNNPQFARSRGNDACCWSHPDPWNTAPNPGNTVPDPGSASSLLVLSQRYQRIMEDPRAYHDPLVSLREHMNQTSIILHQQIASFLLDIN